MKIITVGRDPENDVMIDDPHVSRQHLQIIIKDKYSIILVDSGSTNGTYVNGQKIDGRVKLFPGDVVKIGNTVLPWRSYLSTGETIVEDGASPRTHNNNNVNHDYSANHASHASNANNDNGYNRANYHNSYDDSHNVRDSVNRDYNYGQGYGEKNSSSVGVFVFLMGLIALGINVYLVINFYTSMLNQLVYAFGGGGASIKLFPFYLRGYLGINGKWGFMITSLVLGIAAKFIGGTVDDEDKLTSTGTVLAGIATSVSTIFLALAIFAPQIAKALY